MAQPTTAHIQAFIDRWQTSGAAERANFPQFAVELCHIIGVPHPEPTIPIETENSYVFEKSVPLPHGTTGCIDLYKRGCFVLEAKQGSDAVSAEALRRHKQRKRGTAIRGTPSWDTDNLPEVPNLREVQAAFSPPKKNNSTNKLRPSAPYWHPLNPGPPPPTSPPNSANAPHPASPASPNCWKRWPYWGRHGG